MPARGAAIVLIGFMGTGKSAVGRVLAAQTGWPLFDTDALATERLGMPIGAVFEELGEEAFRAAETATLQALGAPGPAVIATGGGMVLREENRALLRQLGAIVWLSADLETIVSRIGDGADRPLLRGADLRSLLRDREPHYEALATLKIDTSALTLDEVAEACRRGGCYLG